MPRGGSTYRRGGKKKGSKNKATLAKEALLLTVKEQFENKSYDPLSEMIDLAQKQRLGKNDPIRFSFHAANAKKYYPDVTAVAVSIEPPKPLEHTDEAVRRKRIQDLEKKRLAVMPLELLAGEPGSEHDAGL